MVQLSTIEARLVKLGIKMSGWMKPELRELQHILIDSEQIITMAGGRYSGGMALLVATDLRLLLIDKKAMFLTVEDIRYDMISEIDFSVHAFDFCATIFTVNKQHRFTSMRYKKQLRDVIHYAQQRVMEIRQYMHQGSSTTPPATTQQPLFIPNQYNRRATDKVAASQVNSSSSKGSSDEEYLRISHPQSSTQIIGNAAIHGMQSFTAPPRPFMPNPYIKSPLLIRKQISRFYHPRTS